MQRLTPCKDINILLFVHLTVLNKLKALQLSTVGQSTIKHQHSKKLTWWIEAIWTKNAWKCKLFPRVCSQKVCKMSTFARTHAWRRFLHWPTAVSMAVNGCIVLNANNTVFGSKCSFLWLKWFACLYISILCRDRHVTWLNSRSIVTACVSVVWCKSQIPLR